MLDQHTNAGVAQILNERGHRSGQGKRFRGGRIKYLTRAYGLRRRYERLKARGLLTTQELALRLGCTTQAVRQRRLRGTLRIESYPLDDCGRRMFEAPCDTTIERSAV